MALKMIAMQELDAALHTALVRLTLDAARVHNPVWLQSLDEAEEVVREALAPQVISCVLLEAGSPVGWVAASPQGFDVWELHPLLVSPAHQRRGYGRMLVAEIERQALAQNARTMTLTTADAVRATTLGGIDLFNDPLNALARIDVTDSQAGHAYQFWQKVGYVLVGVLPDAEGPGIPSIQLAKRLVSGLGDRPLTDATVRLRGQTTNCCSSG